MAKVSWTQRQDIGPSARTEHAMAYDSTRHRTVLFGGRVSGGGLNGDTWEWDGADWTQLNDVGPAPRAGHALAYDSTRHRVVLFGGVVGGDALVQDTWEWDGTDWTEVADTGPDARVAHALAYDVARTQLLLFGGASSNGVLRGDTWAFDGTDWTQLQDVGPAPRREHAMAYDVARQRVVLYGGGTSNEDASDTWEWNGTAWTQVQDIGPGPSLGGAMTFDGDSVLLFGGASSFTAMPAPQIFGGTWEWAGATWTQRQDIGPSARWGLAVAYDADRERTVLFGGVSVPPGDGAVTTSVLADTWEATVKTAPNGAGGPDPDPDPDPGAPGDFDLAPPNTALFAGAGMGYVSIALTQPPAAETPVDVSVDGQPGATPTPAIPAGADGWYALFSLDGRGPGDLAVSVTIEGVTRTTAVTTVDGPAISSLTINPPAVAPGDDIQLDVTLLDSAPADLLVQVMVWDGLDAGSQVWDLTVASGDASVSATVTLDPGTTPGARAFAATLGFDGAQSISTVATVSVQ